MAELGVAGSAVGVVSLGIQVCQGLVSYLHDYKDYDGDIAAAYGKVEDLAATLELVLGVLNEHSLDDVHVSHGKQLVRGCHGGIQELEKRLKKMKKNGDPKGFRQRFEARLLHLTYPFRKSNLDKLDGTVDELAQRLALTLEILNSRVGTQNQATLDAINDVTDRIETRAIQNASEVQTLLGPQHSIELRHLKSWLSAPDAYASQWFLDSSDYQGWIDGEHRDVSLTGKPGCCKTILCSTIICDLEERLPGDDRHVFTFLYFTFSDQRKQSYRDTLLGVVHQLLCYEPVFQLLSKAEKESRGSVTTDMLEQSLVALAAKVGRFALVLDALDEIPGTRGTRDDAISCLGQLSRKMPKLSVLTTSRPERDLLGLLSEFSARIVQLDESHVNEDIETYVRKELKRKRTLHKLPAPSKQEIQRTVSEQADGMFRWAYCQLEALSKLKRISPKHVTTTLKALPRTLDETHERILVGIDEANRQMALTALRWLTFSERPLSVLELEDACITSHQNDPYVAVDDRAAFGSILDVIPSLVVTTQQGGNEMNPRAAEMMSKTLKKESSFYTKPHGDSDDHGDKVRPTEQIFLGTREARAPALPALAELLANIPRRPSVRSTQIVRLAHFSIKEYVTSDRIATSDASYFASSVDEQQRHLAQDCMAYLYHWYGQLVCKSSSFCDTAFAMAGYAVEFAVVHQGHAELNHIPGWQRGLEMRFVQPSDDVRRRWSVSHYFRFQPDYGITPIDCLDDVPAIYLASYLGLRHTVGLLMEAGCDVYEHSLVVTGARYTPLIAAVESGRDGVVQELLNRGTNPNIPIPARPTRQGRVLLEYNMSVRSDKECSITALLHAIAFQSMSVVELLLNAGADPNTSGDFEPQQGSTGRYCYQWDRVSKIQALNRVGGIQAIHFQWRNSLAAAAVGGLDQIAKLLIKRGANVNAESFGRGTPLQVAVYDSNTDFVQLLLDQGADPLVVEDIDVDEVFNFRDDDQKQRLTKDMSPLGLARNFGLADVVQMLEAHTAAAKAPIANAGDEGQAGSIEQA